MATMMGCRDSVNRSDRASTLNSWAAGSVLS